MRLATGSRAESSRTASGSLEQASLKGEALGSGTTDLASGEPHYLAIQVDGVHVPSGRSPRSSLHLRVIGPPLPQRVRRRRKAADDPIHLREGQGQAALARRNLIESSRQ